MTDEATPTGGAESAAVAVAPETNEPLHGIPRLKAILAGKPDPGKAAPKPEAPKAPEGKPEAPKVAETAEAAPTAEAEDAEASPTEPAESQPPDIKAFAKYLGVSPAELVIDDDGSIGFKTKVDGVDGKAKLSDLRKSFQLESAHTRRLMELSDKEKAFKAEAEQRAADLKARAQQTDQYLELARQELLGELGRTDWATLQATDPVEFSAKYIALQQRTAQLNAALQARHAEEQKAAQAAKAREQDRLATEFKELLNHVPSWADEGVRKEGQKELASFLKNTYQFSDEDVAAVAGSSHKAIRIVLDALAHHKTQAEAKKAKVEVLKKIEAAPKMAKAGAAASQDSEARKLAQLRVAHKKGSKTAGIEILKRTVLARHK